MTHLRMDFVKLSSNTAELPLTASCHFLYGRSHTRTAHLSSVIKAADPKASDIFPLPFLNNLTVVAVHEL